MFLIFLDRELTNEKGREVFPAGGIGGGENRTL